MNFILYVFSNWRVIYSLIKNDFKKQFLGSYLGVAWAFIQPLMMVLVLWAVFELGFRSSPRESEIPFYIWLIAGMFPWFFFASGMSSGYQAITSNAFLLKQISFNPEVLPFVKIVSALIIHFFLIILLMFLLVLEGYIPNIYWLQAPFYMAVLCLLLLGLTWLTSGVYVFVKDINSIVGMILQVGFWLTPIFWSAKKIPEQYEIYVKLNPLYFVVEGYRNTFLRNTWFWEDILHLSIFFVELGVLLFIGLIVFRRLKPNFGDVL